MARKAEPTILQEELYPAARAGLSRAEAAREELDDARLIDLDVDEGSPFLRGQKRISARRSALPRKATHGLLWAMSVAAILCLAALVAGGLYQYGEHSWRFRVESSDNLAIMGTENVSKAQVMEVMGGDIGRNIFFIPLAQQQAQLEQIPWVESASVMRFVPNRLQVEIQERTPVAFARVGSRIALIDAGGTLMDLPRNDLTRRRKYSFPVILGMNPGEPLSTRAPRMKAYAELIRDLDSGGAHYSQDLSEVDLSDLDDVKVRVNDAAGDVLLHLGSSDYLKRYKIYVSHAQEWRQQFQKLESVNLRYDNQVIVNPDMQGTPKLPALTATAAKAAAAAGVKPAALVSRVGRNEPGIPKPVFELSPQKLDPKAAAAKKPAAKPKAKKPAAKPGKNAAVKTAPPKTVVSAPKAGAGTTRAPAPQPEAKKLAQSAPATGSAVSQKPSPAIAKPPANAAPN
ncbi:Cell division protein FtsQ (modular protein) [Candidatus Sulfotelmatobacter kueseliae]|uniref:Cell division protein FtsQ n=1 Tax=Candidatus Sulfotelmatobacter kueseliae TaxID=2042962 RepID=A0A2U3L3K8_9BACT|nr:Cell division protein FtsQ (modular protein) [Candidatus Sulfotelmatobacter kueseliae]